MRIIAFIEKGSDRLLSFHSNLRIKDHCFGSFGETVEIAKADFLENVQDVVEDITVH